MNLNHFIKKPTPILIRDHHSHAKKISKKEFDEYYPGTTDKEREELYNDYLKGKRKL